MTPQEREELEDLEALLASSGWLWLVTRANQYLNEQFKDEVSKLLLTNEPEAAKELAAIREYVLGGLLKGPGRRIEELKHKDDKPTQVPAGHRRGRNL